MLDVIMRRSLRWSLRPVTCPTGAGDGVEEGDAPAPGTAHRTRWRRVALLTLALGGAAAAAVIAGTLTAPRPAPSSPALPRIEVRRAAELPAVDLGFVTQRDHFMVTIGPGAGRGGELGDLLVVADATIAPRGGFPLHRHAGVDVVSIALDGTLTDEEPGQSTDVPAGGVLAIAAGAGIAHAETNRTDLPVRVLQLWFASAKPERAPAYQQLAPGYQQGSDFLPLDLGVVRTDVQVRRGTLAPGETTAWTVARGHAAYVLCAGGQVELDDAHLDDGDGATLAPGRFTVTATGDAPARLVVIDVPAPGARVDR